MDQFEDHPENKKPEDLFEELSHQVDASLAGAPHRMLQEKKKKFLLIKLDKSTFGISLVNVREVMGLTQLSFLPNMPPYYAGLINLRGKIISAIDLKKSLISHDFQGESTPNKRPCVVITELVGGLYGALVDSIVEVVSVPEAQIDRSAQTLQGATVFSGIIRVDQMPLTPILNLEKALRLDELLELSAKRGAA